MVAVKTHCNTVEEEDDPNGSQFYKTKAKLGPIATTFHRMEISRIISREIHKKQARRAPLVREIMVFKKRFPLNLHHKRKEAHICGEQGEGPGGVRVLKRTWSRLPKS